MTTETLCHECGGKFEEHVLTDEIAKLRNTNDGLRRALYEAEAAMRGVLGGPIRGNGGLHPEWEALLNATLNAKAALDRVGGVTMGHGPWNCRFEDEQ
jgi:hypothetical protein